MPLAGNTIALLKLSHSVLIGLDHPNRGGFATMIPLIDIKV